MFNMIFNLKEIANEKYFSFMKEELPFRQQAINSGREEVENKENNPELFYSLTLCLNL